MKNKLNIKKIKKFLGIFTLCLTICVITLFFSFRIKNNARALEEGSIGGWFWSPLIGWGSQSCSNRYFDDYGDWCGIEKQSILNINFDGSSIGLNQSIIKNSTSDSDIVGVFKDSGGDKAITIENILNRTSVSNFNNSFYFDENSGSMIEFDDGSENIFAFNHPDKSFTISLWFKPETVTNSVLFSYGKMGDDSSKMHYYCILKNDKKIYCGINNGNQILEITPLREWTVPEVIPNVWHNITMVYEEFSEDINLIGKLKLYYDYHAISSSDTEYPVMYNSVSSDNYSLLLGNWISQNSDYKNFFGEVDEFRFFQSALTETEIKHNLFHNSNYNVNINNTSGKLSGWAWTNNYGWICFGLTCQGTPPNPDIYPPHASLENTKLYWTGIPGTEIFANMITGWAKIIGLGKDNSDSGWVALDGPNTSNSVDKYKDCVSCVVKDTEPNLISYWKMDEESGDIVSDYSGFANNGFMRNFPNDREFSFEDGKVGSCIYFNGEDYIEIPHNEIYNMGEGDFSFEVWFKSDQAQISGHVINSEYFDLVFEESTLAFQLLNYEPVKIEFINSDSAWHQIFVTVDNNNFIKLYIDGQLAGQVFGIEKYKELVFDSIKIGFGEDGRGFVGYLDTVRFYKQTINEVTVKYNYNYPEKKSCSACFLLLQDDNMDKKNICYGCEKCYIDLDSRLNNCDQCTSCKKYGLVFDTNTSNIKGYAWSGTKDGVGWIEFSPNFSAGVYKSYISAKYGSIYSSANIGTENTIIPPRGRYNATYLIQSRGNITNWISQKVVADSSDGYLYNTDEPWMSQGVSYNFPSNETNYGNILGSIDLGGLENGKYGGITQDFPYRTDQYANCFGEKNIYIPKANEDINGDGIREFVINSATNSDDAYNFWDSKCADNNFPNTGTIIINGDLHIKGNIMYTSGMGINGLSADKLHSILWIVKGDLYIYSNVTKLAGTFIVLGKDGIDCGSNIDDPTEKCGIIYTGDSNNQLIVSGQFLAKNFQFQRTYRSDFREPAELIIYDGRNLINTPPGMGDSLKSLPRWDQIAPY